MTYVYLASFVAGLLLGVRIMIYGVERPREESPSGERSFRLSPAVIVAFTLIFGLVGYPLSRFGAVSAGATAATAAVLGVVAAIVAARLVRKWWTITPEHDVDDERYVLQGHLARVTKPLGADVEGEVSFEVGSEQRVVRARSLDTARLAAGTEVVIERIDGDVAYVEAWADVEKRL
ncbi:MAG TPA: NfeD family protein [Gemmatimonadaceae bacterium]|nr:NfeD family protein [Gemmatimonadaceae bacterium]